MAALLWHAQQEDEGEEEEEKEKKRAAAQPGADGGCQATLTLQHVLEAGLASALWKVDTAKPSPAPRLTDLLAAIPTLPRLAPPNAALR